MLRPDAQRTIADLRALAAFGRVGTGVNRRALTGEDMAARAWLVERMRAAGLEAEIDGIGTVIGRTPGAKRHVLIGSHTDTVPKGGWLDGAMGVIFGLEVARAAMEAGLPGEVGVEVASFCDEEGRFAGLMGSSVFCGTRTLEDALALRAEDGAVLRDAVAAAGLAGREVARLDPARHVAYLEAHIEQGPVLEQAGKQIGIVTEIVGVERGRVIFTGRSDHAGTTPMEMRRDAMMAAARMMTAAQDVLREAGSQGRVTVGAVEEVRPGVINAIPGAVRFTVDLRHPDAQALDVVADAFQKAAESIAAEEGVEVAVDRFFTSPPVVFDPDLVAQVEATARELGLSTRRMVSGAGHDAGYMSQIAPTAMIFIPSRGGRSHCEEEWTDWDHVVDGTRVLYHLARRLIAS